ncbi:hypothetical protein ACFY0G_24140 [Streptomyces sp. NPDC001552]
MVRRLGQAGLLAFGVVRFEGAPEVAEHVGRREALGNKADHHD